MDREIRVLLVEDDQMQRRLMAMLLESVRGVHLLLAADGIEGLEMARTEACDVIVLDLILPGISGMELLRRYRRSGGKAGILALSKADGEAVRAAAIAAGADFFLCKPALWSEVRRIVRFLAGGLTIGCQELLEELNAPDWTGRRQAARCAGILGEREKDHVFLKEAYWLTAKEEGTSMVCVEKNIRKLIKALAKPDNTRFWALFDKRPKETPSNKVFLLALAQAARQREE